HLSAVLVLGRIAHDSLVATLGQPRRTMPFGHGAVHETPSGLRVFDSYHCSRYNTNTGVLTPAMFNAVFAALRAHVDGVQRG
ncbi:MAG: uracil-DNA glycosylase, partial [Alphaproteobacteria bacterium]